jgi:hypothetical protein
MAKNKKKKVRTCRVCGCTDDNCQQCIEKTGQACHWVEKDLCSACAPGGTVDMIVIDSPFGTTTILGLDPEDWHF